MYLAVAWEQVDRYTIDREIFSVSPKFMRIINDSVVRGCLSENYLTRNLSHEIFVTQNIRELRYTTTAVTLKRVPRANYLR